MVISIDRPTYEGLRIDIFTLALEFGIEKWLAERDGKPAKNTVENAPKKSLIRVPKTGRPRKVPASQAAQVETESEVETGGESEAESESETQPTPIPVPVIEAKPFTADDVFEALKKVVAAKGEPEGRAILAKFGAPRRSSLDPAKFGPFIEACEQAIQ